MWREKLLSLASLVSHDVPWRSVWHSWHRRNGTHMFVRVHSSLKHVQTAKRLMLLQPWIDKIKSKHGQWFERISYHREQKMLVFIYLYDLKSAYLNITLFWHTLTMVDIGWQKRYKVFLLSSAITFEQSPHRKIGGAESAYSAHANGLKHFFGKIYFYNSV